jgi:hypothetical protein
MALSAQQKPEEKNNPIKKCIKYKLQLCVYLRFIKNGIIHSYIIKRIPRRSLAVFLVVVVVVALCNPRSPSVAVAADGYYYAAAVDLTAPL